MKQPYLFVFSGSSGVGKSTIVREILKKYRNIKPSISVTTRSKRENEEDTIDYFFTSRDAFKKFIEQDKLLEWEEVYKNCFYGSLKSFIATIMEKGYHVVFDIDVKGALNIKRLYKERVILFFIKVNDLNTLSHRLHTRKLDVIESINERLTKVDKELNYEPSFDHVLENRVLDDTLNMVYKIIDSYIKKDEFI